MKIKNKLMFCFFLFHLFFDESNGKPLLENILEDLTSSLDLSKGSKLPMLEMLTQNVIKTPDGAIIGEGDIVTFFPQLKGPKINGELWPEGVIPYMFHKSVDLEHQTLLLEAMQHWEENTCIRFKIKTKRDKQFLRFRTDTSGCWSAVGRIFDRPGAQDISLGSGCFKFYTAIHEIGHALGFYHEHARTDRDQFVEILWSNVKPGMEIQFEQRKTRNEGLEYDYRSVMHYPAWAFSKSPLKASVILAKNPFVQYLIDEEKNSISFRDKKLTNILYKCVEKCPNVKDLECLNKGILSPNKTNGQNCTCLCAPGFGGKTCEIINERNKTNLVQPKCGGNVTTEGLISTPFYPYRGDEFQSCGYWIRAPINQIVRVTFVDFSFAEPYTDESDDQSLCLYESVEIRKRENIYSGSIYCGQQIAPNTVMESEGRDFLIIIIADNQKKGRGLKARVKFIFNTSKGKSNKQQNKGKSNQSTKKDLVSDVLEGIL